MPSQLEMKVFTVRSVKVKRKEKMRKNFKITLQNNTPDNKSFISLGRQQQNQKTLQIKKLNLLKMKQDYESHDLWLKQDQIFVSRHEIVKAGETKRAQSAERSKRISRLLQGIDAGAKFSFLKKDLTRDSRYLTPVLT